MQFLVAVVRSGPLPLLRSGFPVQSLGVFCLAALVCFLCPSNLKAAPEIDPALELLLKKDPAVLASSAHQVLPQSYLPAITREDTDVLVDLFLELDPSSRWAPPTAKTVARFGDILAVRLPLADLPEVLKVPDLERARLSRPLRPQLDQSGSVVGIGSAWSIGQEDRVARGTTGEGVIVGIVDSGIDFNHPDFWDDEGSRVMLYWDQGGVDGVLPKGFEFGVETSRAAINAGGIRGRDASGHGTHVAGIAAGNGRASLSSDQGPYVGMAPNADIIGVRTLFTEFTLAVGVDYIIDRAKKAGMPAVINMSIGGHFGPHNGNTPFERAIQNAVEPGYLVVVAAGNDAERNFHSEVFLEKGETKTVELNFPLYRIRSEQFNYVDFEAWFDEDDRYRITLIDPYDDVAMVLNWGDREKTEETSSSTLRGWNIRDLDMGSVVVGIDAKRADIGADRASGVWKIQIEALEVASGEVDLWITAWGNDRNQIPEFQNFIDIEETITVPGTAQGVLTVGAVSTRNCWPNAQFEESCYTRTTPVGDVTWFSGVGPTADGRVKPDILAPGGGILSAFSSDVPASSYTEDELNNLRTPNEQYWIRRGTSMATPHVAGTVALLLEQFPNLTFDQMIGRLQSRGLHRVDQRTGAAVVELRSGEALTPLTELFLGDVRLEPEGVEIRWNVLKEFAQTEYQVFRGFSPEGPFHRIATADEGQPREYSVLDQYLEPGRTHYYKVLATDAFGLEEELGIMEIVVPGVAQSVLRAPRPNPAQGPVQLQFFLAPHETNGTYRLEVFDLQGRRVRELGSSHRPAAGLETTETWDLRGESGLPVSAGVYWVRLLQEDESGASIRSPMTTRLLVLPS